MSSDNQTLTLIHTKNMAVIYPAV